MLTATIENTTYQGESEEDIMEALHQEYCMLNRERLLDFTCPLPGHAEDWRPLVRLHLQEA